MSFDKRRFSAYKRSLRVHVRAAENLFMCGHDVMLSDVSPFTPHLMSGSLVLGCFGKIVGALGPTPEIILVRDSLPNAVVMSLMNAAETSLEDARLASLGAMSQMRSRAADAFQAIGLRAGDVSELTSAAQVMNQPVMLRNDRCDERFLLAIANGALGIDLGVRFLNRRSLIFRARDDSGVFDADVFGLSLTNGDQLMISSRSRKFLVRISEVIRDRTIEIREFRPERNDAFTRDISSILKLVTDDRVMRTLPEMSFRSDVDINVIPNLTVFGEGGVRIRKNDALIQVTSANGDMTSYGPSPEGTLGYLVRRAALSLYLERTQDAPRDEDLTANEVAELSAACQEKDTGYGP